MGKSSFALITILTILAVLTLTGCPVTPVDKNPEEEGYPESPAAEDPEEENDNTIRAPDNLEIQILSETQIKLTWIDNSDDEDGFLIEQSEDDITFTEIARTPPNTTSYIVTDLVPNQNYYFRVSAFKEDLYSGFAFAGPGYIEEILGNNYLGELQLQYSNTFPEFDETTSMEVEINKYGGVFIEAGSLVYSGESEIPEQSKIKREGTLDLQPLGEIVVGTDVIVSINENTAYDEQYKYWVWDDQILDWDLRVEENPTGLWNGGLAFNLDDAVLFGDTVGEQNAQGAVLWTLTLTPSLVP